MNATTHIVAPEEIMAFLDGELSATETKVVSAHLESCAECALLANEIRSTSQALAGWSVEAVPERLDAFVNTLGAEAGSDRVIGRSGASSRTNLRSWKFWAMGTGGAVLAVLLVGIFLSSSRRTPAPPSASMISRRETNRPLVVRPSEPPPKDERRTSTASFLSATSMPAVTDEVEDKAVAGPSATPAPMIARNASLTIRVKNVDSARSALDAVLARHGGYSAQLNVTRSENTARALQASLRIPAAELTSTMGDLKGLGSVENESQSGEEVTQQHTDLIARLKTARETEERLRGILQQRTGKISDVLEVEQEIARVRGEIERMEAEQKALQHRVDFASVEIQLSEVYKAPLSSLDDSVAARIHNGFVAGYHNATETLLGFLLFFEEYGPSMVIWIILLGLPPVLIWRRYRRVRSRL